MTTADEIPAETREQNLPLSVAAAVAVRPAGEQGASRRYLAPGG